MAEATRNLRDGWRLAVGTLTAIRVTPPAAVTPDTARDAMLLAPLAALPLGVLVTLVGLLGQAVDLPRLALGIAAVGALVAGSRALHVDGLSDTADGLTSSYDAERSLRVMRSGTAGPAGVAAVVVVLGVQSAALAPLLSTVRGAVLAGVLVCVSRCALLITCADGVHGARADGLGSAFVRTVPVPATAGIWAVAVIGISLLDPRHLHGAAAGVLAVLVVLVLVQRAVRRFGGVTGDVFGAAIELALATLLLIA